MSTISAPAACLKISAGVLNTDRSNNHVDDLGKICVCLGCGISSELAMILYIIPESALIWDSISKAPGRSCELYRIHVTEMLISD